MSNIISYLRTDCVEWRSLENFKTIINALLMHYRLAINNVINTKKPPVRMAKYLIGAGKETLTPGLFHGKEAL